MVFGVVRAQEIKRVSLQPTLASSGKQMYAEYCAVCHGSGGKGDGPGVAALKKRPADLTQLARTNGGRFPTLRVRYSITGDEAIAAHGSREMPVWGEVLRSLRPDEPAEAQIRINVLEAYIESMQAQ